MKKTTKTANTVSPCAPETQTRESLGTGQEPKLFQAVDADGKEKSLQVLEDADVAFDPTRQYLDLTRAEKRRTTALMMAIQAYQGLIIKDAEMLDAVDRRAQRGDGPKITPATISGITEAAIEFDWFISGQYEQDVLVDHARRANKSGKKSAPVQPPSVPTDDAAGSQAQDQNQEPAK